MTEKSVLIVDDTDMQRSLLRDVLRKMGVSVIYEAKDGVEGVRAARFYKPDLILLDLSMPRMNGFEACAKIRCFADKTTLPIIVLTGQDRATTIEQIYTLGANDYLDKPYNIYEISNRIKFHLQFSSDISALSHFENFMSSELDIAKKMQQKILPDVKKIQNKLQAVYLDFYGYYQPSTGLGGDSWLVKIRHNGHPVFFMFDVAGHGINAAINNSFVISVCNALFQEYKKGQRKEFCPENFLSALNAILCDRLQGDTFCAGLCMSYNPEKKTIDYAACALPPLRVLSGTETKIASYPCNGLPMCVTKKCFCPTVGQFVLNKNDFLFAMTDGLIESLSNKHDASDLNKYGRLLPGERLLESCFEYISRYPVEISTKNAIDFIITNFLDNDYDLSTDDVTLLSVKVS